MVLEYMDCRGLDFVLQQAPGHVIPEWVIAGIAFQVLWGLGYLAHERRVHRDVKPANLLVNSSGQVRRLLAQWLVADAELVTYSVTVSYPHLSN